MNANKSITSELLFTSTLEIPTIRVVVDNSKLKPIPTGSIRIGDLVKEHELKSERASRLAVARTKLASEIETVYAGDVDLSAMRLSIGLSQTQLAEKAGLTQSQIAKAESGANLEGVTLKKISQALGVDAGQVFTAWSRKNDSRQIATRASNQAASIS